MGFRWFVTKRKARPRRRARNTVHYETHKEDARTLVHARLSYWNHFYGHSYKRVAIRNQKSRWGSCSTNQNLNFNYKILFLPIELVDYIIVHELCHLKHFNHGEEFWATVGEAIPDYIVRKNNLRKVSLHINTSIQKGITLTFQSPITAS